jgi:hypothetical protein
MTIIAGSLQGIARALSGQGYELITEVSFTRTPFKSGGRWVCEVRRAG